MKDSGLTTEVPIEPMFTIIPLISFSNQISVGNTTLVVRLSNLERLESDYRHVLGVLGLHTEGPPRVAHLGLQHHLENTHAQSMNFLRTYRNHNSNIKCVTGLCTGKVPDNLSLLSSLKNSDAHVLIEATCLPKQQHANFLMGIVVKDITGKKLRNEEFIHLSDLISKTVQNCLPELLIT